ncbi:uncharacterized protein N0V89_003280 [Didymosphaeria variabile]|uniref:MFS general substrate transporter n=1 Tax=Didymosphaeria variabile TaxID=1932322 RepID=A0A9W8XTP3_9PLEO|nr:uncharacterized protein N0V89_003280 [Didymosphaeria variabile]KAJ4358696.1 hypothetical protein N0V89_003280 [Didymosphaeria variabile]
MADAKTLDFAYIGGLNFSMAMLVAPLTNLATRRVSVKLPMSLGIAFFCGGFLAGSFSTKIWQLYLFQGVFVGWGVGLVWVPANAIIPQWFTTKRSLANGICAAGSGIGGLIMCFSTEAMLSSLGLAWTMRITAVIIVVVLVPATVLIQPCITDDQPHQRMFDWHLVKRYQVLLLLAWSLVIMFGYITLMFSLSDYTLSIGKSQRASATVAAVLNLGCAIGRPFIGFASDRYGRIRVAGIITFACSLLVFTVWLPTMSFAALLVFAFTGGAALGIFWVAIGPLAAEVVDLRDVTSYLSLSSLTVVLPCSCKLAL